MSKLVSTFLATFAIWVVVLTQFANAANPPDAYQVGYFPNATVGGALNLTNTGLNRGGPNGGNICANVYVFDPGSSMMAPELISCCSCPIAPNALAHLTVVNDLNGNNLTKGIPKSISVGVVATSQATCDASTAATGNLVGGLRAWGVSFHTLPSGALGVTDIQFSNADLSPTELVYLTSTCGWIEADGSGYGICKSCPFFPGALGGTKQ